MENSAYVLERVRADLFRRCDAICSNASSFLLNFFNWIVSLSLDT